MEDSNANWGDPTVVLILKTAQDRELSSGTSRQINNPKHRDLAWNSFGTFNRDPSRKVWEVSPHWSAVNRILVALAPSLRCLLNISASPGRSYFQTLSRTSSTNAKSLTTGEVLDRMIVAWWSLLTAFACLHGPQWFHLRDRSDHWLYPMYVLTDV